MFNSISNKKSTSEKLENGIKKLENKEKNTDRYTSKAYYLNLKGRLYQKQRMYNDALEAYKAAIEAGVNAKVPAVHAIHAAYHIGWLYRHGHIETSGNVNIYDYAFVYFYEAASQIKKLEKFMEKLNEQSHKDKKLYHSIIKKYQTMLPAKLEECIKLKKSLENNLKILQEQKESFSEQRQQLQQRSPLEVLSTIITIYKQQQIEIIETEENLAQSIGLRPFYHTVQTCLSQILASYYLANAKVLATAPSEWLQKAKAGYALVDKTLAVIGAATSFPGINPIGLANASLNLFAEASFQYWEKKENEANANKAARISEYFHSFEDITNFTKQCCNKLVKVDGKFLKKNKQIFQNDAVKAKEFGELIAQQLVCTLLSFKSDERNFSAELFMKHFFATKELEQKLKKVEKHEEKNLIEDEKQKEKSKISKVKNNSPRKQRTALPQGWLQVDIDNDIKWCFKVLDKCPTVEEALPGKFYLVKNIETEQYELYIKDVSDPNNEILKLLNIEDISELTETLSALNINKLKAYEKIKIQEILLYYEKKVFESQQSNKVAPESDNTPLELLTSVQKEIKAKLDTADNNHKSRVAKANLDKIGFFALGIEHKNSDIANYYNVKEDDIIEELPKGCTII